MSNQGLKSGFIALQNLKLFALAGLLVFACEKKQAKDEVSTVESETELDHIGLIPHDPRIDTLDFQVCNENQIYPFFHHRNVSFKGEKRALVDEIMSKFESTTSGEEGYITIRFVVNCDGISGRFRMIQMDDSYQFKTFSEDLRNQIYGITTSLEGWDVMKIEEVSYDYVRYLTYKIKDGAVTDILP